MPHTLLRFDKTREDTSDVYTTIHDPSLGCSFDSRDDIRIYVAKQVLGMGVFYKQERETYTEYDWLSRSMRRKNRWVRVKQDLSHLTDYTAQQYYELKFLQDNFIKIETKSQADDYILKLNEYLTTYWNAEEDKAVCNSGAFNGDTLASLTFDELIQYYREYALNWNTVTDSGTRLYVSIPYQADLANDIMMEFIRRRTELENRLVALAEEGLLKQLGRDAFFVLRFIETATGQLGVFGKLLQAATLLAGFPSIAATVAKAVAAVNKVLEPVFIINKAIAIKDMVSDGDIGRAMVSVSDFTSGDAAFILRNGGLALQDDTNAMLRLLDYAADRVGVGMTTEDIENEVKGWLEGIELPHIVDWDLEINFPSINLPDVTPEFDFDFIDFGSMRISGIKFDLPDIPDLRLRGAFRNIPNVPKLQLKGTAFTQLSNFIDGIDFLKLPKLERITFLNLLKQTYNGKGIDMSFIETIENGFNKAGDILDGVVETVDDMFDLIGSDTRIADDYEEAKNEVKENVEKVVDRGVDMGIENFSNRLMGWLPIVLIGGLLILNLPVGKKRS